MESSVYSKMTFCEKEVAIALEASDWNAVWASDLCLGRTGTTEGMGTGFLLDSIWNLRRCLWIWNLWLFI